jgi:hypothetical protein
MQGNNPSMMMNLAGSARHEGRPRRLLAGAALAFWLAAGPASAQWFGGYSDDAPIPPQGITRMLASRGFSDVTRPRFDGEVYRVDATNRFGERVRITVDAFDGDIIDRKRLARMDEPFGGPLLPPQNVGRGGPMIEEPIAPPRPAPVETLRPDKPGGPRQQQAARSEPSQQIRKPTSLPPRPSEAQPAQPRVVPPAVAAPKRDVLKAKPVETVAAPTTAPKPVRVIGGVTPLNPAQPATAQPASPESPATPDAAPETPPL